MNYLNGFGNHFESEAVPGALPQGRNSPKEPLLGLIPEQLSGSAFTMERSQNLRSWLYRIHPSTFHGKSEAFSQKGWVSKFANPEATSPDPMRWSAVQTPNQSQNFIEGVRTMAATAKTPGFVVNHYQFNSPMGDQYFYNADGELIFVPWQGDLEVKTEFGNLNVKPQEIVVIPKGVKFQINPLSSGWCQGYLGENTGHPFVLPNLGPLGANALASPRDFEYPVACFEEKNTAVQVVVKFAHSFWAYQQNHSPLDVVAWHGNYAPYKYDLRKFNTMGTVSYDHPDPSIYTVLTSPSATAGQANADFVIFPPRWLVGEKTFRPPYYHRNMMSEYMGLIYGEYDAKSEGFEPGGASLHNCMTPHGPDTETFYKAIKASEEPQKIDKTMAFMFEASQVFYPSEFAIAASERQKDYLNCWQNFKPLFGKN